MTRWDYFPMAPGPCAPAADVQGGWQITSYFGGRVDPLTGVPGSHGGQDLAYGGCGGAHIYAPSSGTLSQAWDSSGGGNWTGITLDDGSYIGIGHASEFAPGGSYRRVAAGELVAYCDSTGGSTGDHVHIAYRPAGAYSYADPYDLLEDSQHRPVGGGGGWEEPDMTDDDHNRIMSNIGALLDHRMRQFGTSNLLWQDGDDYFEVLTDGEGRRVRRMLDPGELVALRTGATMAEEPVVDVRTMAQAQQDAVRAWREV